MDDDDDEEEDDDDDDDDDDDGNGNDSGNGNGNDTDTDNGNNNDSGNGNGNADGNGSGGGGGSGSGSEHVRNGCKCIRIAANVNHAFVRVVCNGYIRKDNQSSLGSRQHLMDWVARKPLCGPCVTTVMFYKCARALCDMRSAGLHAYLHRS